MKKLLVIGAGFLQTFVIKKAKELGYYVIAIDGNSNAEGFKYSDEYNCIDILDKIACLEYAKERNVNGVMTAATDFGVLTAAYIAQEMNLPGLNYASAQLVKNKYLVKKFFYENQIDDAEQMAYEVNVDTDIDVLSKKINFPVMVKPCDGSGSRGTSKVSILSELKNACDFAINNSITYQAEIEPFILGQECGVESFVESGNIHIMAIMKKWMTNPPYYAELGHAIPSGLSEKLEEKIRCCVKRAIQVLGINFGAVNMDLLVTAEGKVHIIDVGARMGGNLIGSHIIQMGTGVDYLANLIKATMSDPFDMKQINESKNVVTRLLALTPGVVMGLPNMKLIAAQNFVEIQHHIHVGDVINQYRTNLDGFGYVIAVADNFEEALENAVNAKNAIDYGIQRG